jgi:hypothetical protein
MVRLMRRQGLLCLNHFFVVRLYLKHASESWLVCVYKLSITWHELSGRRWAFTPTAILQRSNQGFGICDIMTVICICQLLYDLFCGLVIAADIET